LVLFWNNSQKLEQHAPHYRGFGSTECRRFNQWWGGNVGTVNFEALKNLIEEKRKSGISLTTLGFGRGNYNDHLMEQLADVGNGNYAYMTLGSLDGNA